MVTTHKQYTSLYHMNTINRLFHQPRNELARYFLLRKRGRLYYFLFFKYISVLIHSYILVDTITNVDTQNTFVVA